MAYIIGLVTPEEEKELERRGWELEDPPLTLGNEFETPEDCKPSRYRMVYVDNDMPAIMSGPDWDLGEK